MPRRLGILGGTFDPVHLGHLRIAEEASELLGFSRFVFIPAADPPHKAGQCITPFEHRWKMLQSAVRGNSRFELSDLEQKSSGKSYTVVTLTRLTETIPADTQLYFLVGLDSFMEVDTWWHYRELFELARMVVGRRPGYPEALLQEFIRKKISAGYAWDDQTSAFIHPRFLPIHLIENTCMGISSTQIRRLVREGRSIRYLVPDDVMSYIAKSILYAAPEREY